MNKFMVIIQLFTVMAHTMHALVLLLTMMKQVPILGLFTPPLDMAKVFSASIQTLKKMDQNYLQNNTKLNLFQIDLR